MGLINPFDVFTIFSKLMSFFKLTTTSMTLRFTQPILIKRRWMINKRVMREELILVEIKITIRVKEAVANIINQGNIASTKHSFQ